MQSKNFLKIPFTWMMIIFSCLFLGTLIFTFFNDRFYNMPIGQITQITDIQSQKVTDEHKNKDIKESGYKFHMNDISATIGLYNLPHMDKLLKIVAEQNEEAESSFQLKRIADAMEEILRLVKKDMEPKKK